MIHTVVPPPRRNISVPGCRRNTSANAPKCDMNSTEIRSIALHHPFDAEFGMPVLAGVVIDDLSPMRRTRLLGQDRNEAVHLAVDLDGLHHLAAVGFQPAVEIVEPDARHAPGCPVEEFAGPALAHGIVTPFLPPRDQIVTLFEDHAAQFGEFRRANPANRRPS